jgi:putative endonuclease
MAENHLKSKGYRLIKRNYYTKIGEVDLIMKDTNGYYVFIEVKKRTGIDYGRPVEYINKYKMKKIIRTSEYYIVANKLSGNDFRFDAVEIIEWKNGKIEINHIKNIFI